MEYVRVFAEYSSSGLEMLGIGVIALVAIYSTYKAIVLMARRFDRRTIYREYRHFLAKGILLGLELLIAADIIKTVALDLTFRSVGVLGLIVLVRTFLSFTLEVEMTGHWPWQQKADDL